MLCKVKTSKKKRMLKKILVDFSHKENVITRYAIIYIKQNAWDNTKQAKSFIFIVVPQQNSRNLVVNRGKKW